MKIPLFILLFLACVSSQAQVIRGTVLDKQTREPLEQAFVKLNQSETRLTNQLGSFSFEIINHNHENFRLSISYIGYQTIQLNVKPGEVTEILMEKGTVNLQEVVITPQSPATFNTITRIDLNLQPARSAQDVLRTVPGLFIGQHQGGGKAEQIFLRGFDIDHGTDVNLSVDGLPVNMVSHAHGQGYADLHFVIPELIGNVDYGKGPYYASFGNMGTAGYVSLNTLNSLDKSTIKIEGGQFNTLRTLAMIDLLSKRQKEVGTNAYIASEFLNSDGPFVSAQHFNRFNLFGKFNTRIGNQNKLSVLASHLNSDWDASGQVPLRAIQSGMIGRFGAIDDSEGGYTSRSNLSAKLTTYLGETANIENQVYYSRYHFNLHSNFTFYLNDPVNGDQIRQREGRDIFGFQSKIKSEKILGGWQSSLTTGAGLRYDKIANSELSHTISRNQILSYKQLGDITETNMFAFVDKSFQKDKWLIQFGSRLDYLHFNYRDILATTLPSKQKFIISPKVNLRYTLKNNAQLFIKAGKGFHSNDARVVVQDPGHILPAAYGWDLGINFKPVSGLFVTAAVWHLYLQQEFVYVGDEGIVEPSGKTRRTGIDVSGRYQVNNWLFADINMNLAKPRIIDNKSGEDHVPLAPTFTTTGGLNWQAPNGISGGLRFRYLEDRPATEDNSVVAKGYMITDFSFNYTRKKFEVGIAIENLFNREWNETQFNTLSRLKNETAPVEEIHFTPGVPFFARLKMAVFF